MDNRRAVRPQSATFPTSSASTNAETRSTAADGRDGRSLREVPREEEARLAKIAAAVPGVICELLQRPDGTWSALYASPQIRAIYGFDADQLQLESTATFDRIHPDDLPVVLAALERSAKTLTLCCHEYRVLNPERGELWVEVRATPLRDSDGSTHLQGFLADVTERRRGVDAMRGMRERLVTALGAGGMGTWVWDLINDRVELDDAALEVFGRTREELGAVTPGELLRSFVHAEDLARAEKQTVWSRESNHHYRGEFRIRLPDDRTRCLSAKGIVETDASGRPLRMTGVCLDVTAQKRGEEAQLRSQKLEALGTLAAGIAHDFNNLLFAMLGNTKLLAAQLAADHPGQPDIAEIESAVMRATELVRGIVACSRPSEPKREVTCLRTVVEGTLELLRASLPGWIEIDARYGPGLLPIAADRLQLNQIMVQLVTNAAQAIGDAHGVIELDLDMVTGDDATHPSELGSGQYVRLSVSDSGCGMRPAALERIFDPFYTSKLPGQGTGLGLAVVHSIVRGHDGMITVSSEPGRGSVFHLFFPALSLADGAQQPPAPPPPMAAPRARGERILVVDDEPTLVSLTARILGRIGYRVRGFTDPVEALSAFRNAPDAFDALVTDLSMPAMSGFDLVREVLAIRPDLPVLMTSGYLGHEDQAQAQLKGIRELIPKPNTVEVLGEALDRAFRKS